MSSSRRGFFQAIGAFGASLAPVRAQQPREPGAVKPNPAYVAVEDVAGLPRVLIIGDSISIGYTLPLRALLTGKMNIHRIPTNGGPTTNGIAHIDEWLGAKQWDAIHFNFGLHDLKVMENGKQQVALDDYAKNMDALAARMKQTGAKLICALTTPVPAGKLNPPRDPQDVVRYNDAARRVMERHGIAINDLYAAVLPKLEALQLPANVHFKPEGYEFLAARVAEALR